MRLLKGRRHAVTALAFATANNLLAAAGEHGGVDVWDTATGAHVANFLVRVDRFLGRNMVFMSEHELLAPQWEGFMRCDLRTNKACRVFRQVRGWPTYYADQQGTYLVYTGTATALRAYRVVGNQSQRQWQLPLPGSMLHIEPLITPDGRTVVSQRRSFAPHPPKIEIVAHSLRSGKLVAEWPCPSLTLRGLTIDEDGRRLMGFDARHVYGWDFRTPQMPPKILENPSALDFTGLALHPDGRTAATIANDRYVRVWDTGTLALQTTWEWNIGKLHTIRYSLDGLRAAVGSGRGTVLVWDVA